MKKLALALAVILIMAILFTLTVGYNVRQDNNAIILLPGFFGSILVDEENIYWITFPLNGHDDYIEPRKSKKDVITRLYETLVMDEYGNRKVEMYPPPSDNIDFIGGTYNTYANLYEELQNRFATDYDIVHFQYDWMKSGPHNAQKLDEYITNKGYNDVILLCHSMGGLVANNYLALGENQRNKVSLMATFGSPHGGVVDTLAVLESRKFSGLPVMFSALFGDMVFDIARNMPAVLHMLPNEVLLDSPYYKNAEGNHPSFIRVETTYGEYEYLTDWEDIVELYSSREWSKYIDDEDKKGEQKDIFSEALQTFDDLYFTDTDGQKKHITSKVNSYFFVGSLLGLSANACIQYNLNGTVTIINEKKYTDGTVSIPSASCGLSLDDNKRVFYYEGVNHNNIIMMNDKDKETPLDEISKLINKL
ncbi:MAG: esterase/lipase family protein [Bacillota bacterium]